jgi:uncharacterized repeat protein (TIGR04138 family)
LFRERPAVSFHPPGKPAVPRSIAHETKALSRLLRQDRRYKPEAYQFVRAGLGFAQDVLSMGSEIGGRERGKEGQAVNHVTGQDLCFALRQFAHLQFGLMARLVLADWGIRSTSDLGEIVYNLIRVGIMTKSPSDRREDFDDVYDFEQALVRDFRITADSRETAA